MLTIRSFRNADPPRLLELWQKTQQQQDQFVPLLHPSHNQLQSQILGLPMLDSRSIMIAFEEDVPVGYIHTTLAPDDDGHSFDPTTGQICFLCVDPKYHDVPGAAAALIRAGEDYLSGLGAQKIYGGSPSPSAPFYTGFYGGGEAVGILHSDQTIVNAFHEANYQIHQQTGWFHLDLRNYSPEVTLEMVGFYAETTIEIQEIPGAKTWWEGCIQANGIWFDAMAYQIQENRPVARLRIRISYPDTENILAMYGGNWLASLIELRVHPDFASEGTKKYLLEETVRYLAAQNQVVQIEAHVAEDSPLFTLLCGQSWQERDSGCIFVKNVNGS
jgi:ribosomal protein S18 acetylase RimI-like enzyme